MRGHSYNTAGALRAKALAEHAVRLRSLHVQAPLGLLMPLRIRLVGEVLTMC